MAFAISSGSAKRRIGISCIISCVTAVSVLPADFDLLLMMEYSRWVPVAPGNTLFTVIPSAATSLASVFDQLATAARMVLDTPSPCKGC